MPITKSNLSQPEKKALIDHSRKHKLYPYLYQFRKPIIAANFGTADGAIGSYFTMEFTAPEILPIVSFATSFIITPNTIVDIFALVISYKPTMSMADAASVVKPTDEGNKTYQLLSNGGAINDFQVFYPLDWYMERGSKIYMHVYAGATTIAAATATNIMTGQVVLGTLPTGE
jgi:hypothetical protein